MDNAIDDGELRGGKKRVSKNQMAAAND